VKSKGLSERRAAKLVGVSRAVLRYKGRLRDDSKLRRAIQRIAQAKRAYGYRMVWRKLRQQGLQVNHKCVYRIYREEKLALRRKRRRKTPEHLRVVIPTPEAPNICWSMDFVSDALIDGRAIRILTVIDDATRESVGLVAGHSFTGLRLAETLDRLAMQRGTYPQYLRCDNGPEMRSAAVGTNQPGENGIHRAWQTIQERLLRVLQRHPTSGVSEPRAVHLGSRGTAQTRRLPTRVQRGKTP
jgi:putative transposase